MDSENAQLLAEQARDALWRDDFASQALGMVFLAIGPGFARMTMPVRQDMLNGHGICHGGFITTFADTAMAFASNSHNEAALATNLSVDFITPAKLGDVLTAEARELARTKRTGVYDTRVTNAEGKTIAVMRGRVQRAPGKPVIGV